jgi:hypothetical protein
MMVYIPSVNGRVIEYPKEDGPYTVFGAGICTGRGFNGNVSFYSHWWPFWYLNYSQTISYGFKKFSLLKVNGSIQEIEYPATIILYGFKGFAPTYWMFETPFLCLIKIVIGKCEQILISDDS